MNAASLSFLALCLVLAASNTAHAQHDTHWWANRSTMVHLFEWKWSDIAKECEQFLAPHGYAGVQVSPVTENIVLKGHPWYERYQPVSYKLRTRSGSKAEFADMTRRCNAVGVRIYVDVLLNHMAADHHTGVVHGTAGSIADPEHLNFPAVPYSAKHFHSPCGINDYDNRFEVQNCELVGLRDLDQSSEFVRQQLVQHLNQLVALGVAGYRVDAAKHIAAKDLKVIYNRVRNLNTKHGFPRNSRPFVYQEVIDHGKGVISRDEYTSMGAVTEFRYSEEIGRAFRGHNQLKWLQSFGTAWGFMESKYAFVYVDNHDNQREHGEPLHYRDGKPYKMATAFALSFPFGINRVMSSYDFSYSSQPAPVNADGSIKSPTFDKNGACTNGWVCEHRWRQIYNMVGFKNQVRGTKVNNWWDNGDNQIAFSRGNRGFIAFNGNKWDLRKRLQTRLPAGVYCDVISGSLIKGRCTGKSVTVNASGFADIIIGKDEFDGVLAIHTGAKITKNKKP